MKLAIAAGDAIKPTADDAKFTGDLGDDGKYHATITGLETGTQVKAGDYQAYFYDADSKEVLGDYVKIGAFTYTTGSTPNDIKTESNSDGEDVTTGVGSDTEAGK